MSFSLTRTHARAHATRVWAAALAAVLAVSTVTFVSAPADAVRATGGAADFPYIEWVNWGSHGDSLIPNGSGTITRVESFVAGGQTFETTCVLSNITRTRGANQAGKPTNALISAWRSGTWQGDGFDNLYTLPAGAATGILNIHDSNSVEFDVSCEVELVVGATRTPVPVAGLAIAQAESAVTGSSAGGNVQEFIAATAPSSATWRILERIRGNNCPEFNSTRRYTSGGGSRLEIRGTASDTCETTSNRMPNPTAVALIDGATSATDVTVHGRGMEAVAIGVTIPFDFGDAPSGYGAAGAIVRAQFTGGTVSNTTSTGTTTNIFNMTLAAHAQPALRLGASVDYEESSIPNGTASGDDGNDSDDENGVAFPSSLTVTPGGTYTLSNVSCTASASSPGFVAGWIDWHGDGTFDAGDKSANVACPNGTNNVNLVFTVPSTAPAYATVPTFARLRVAPTAAQLTPTGMSIGGEVEDYATTAQWPQLPSMTLDKTHTGGAFTTGSTLTYSLVVTNTGNVPLTSVAITDPTATVSGCTFATLAVGATGTCSATRVVTAGNFSAGSYTNTATVNARDPQNVALTPVTDSVTVRRVATAANDNDSTTAGVAITRSAANGVLVNDSGHLLTVTSHVPLNPAVGTLSIAANGSYVFTPAAGFSGTASSVYTATDGFGITVTATLAIVVTPVANPDSGSTPSGTPVTLTQTTLINDDLGSSLQVVSVASATNGSAVRNGDGSVTYTPNAGFSGTGTYTYTVQDSSGQTATSTVTITVTPTAGPDSGTTPAGTPITWTETQLINDDAGTALDVVSITQPSNGVAVLNGDDSVTYTPNAGFSGTDTYTYTVTDSLGQLATSTVTVTVTPTAGPDAGTTPAETPFTLTQAQLTNDDVGTSLDVVAVTQPSNGTTVLNGDGSVTYTPNDDFSGVDTYTYTVEDASGQQVTATVTMTVTPTAGPDSASTPSGTPVTLTEAELTNDDVGSSLDVIAITQPSNGATVLNGDGSVTYTPNAGFSGIDTYTYTVEDASGQEVTATVTITVGPAAGPDSGTTPAETPISWTEAELINDDLGTGLEVVSATNGTNGIVTVNLTTGEVTYTPNDGFSGEDTFTYTVQDDAGQSVTATVTVTVTPTAGPNSGTTPAETPFTWTESTLLLNDVGTALEVVSVTLPGDGSAAINGDGSITYTPDDGFSGTDSFTYTVEDAEGQLVSATVTVLVTPTAGPDSAATASGTPVTLTEAELTNDDLGSSLDVIAITQPSNGATVLNGDGSVTYTPDPGFSGTDTYTYTVEDAEGQQVTATVTITVGPVAGPDSGTTPAETPVSWTEAELINDDLGTDLEVASATNGSNGIVMVNVTTGEVTYTPNDGFSGTDTFTYTAEDASGQEATATVTVVVTPTAGADSGTTPAETPIDWTEAELINDDLGSDLEVVDATDGANGTTVVNGDGSVTYTPNAGFSGTDTFTYTVEDAEGQEATATVTVVVTPTAGPDSGTTPAQTPIDWTRTDLINDDRGSSLDVVDTTDGANGTTVVNGDGSVTYTPNPGFSGTDTFTYTVEDAEGQEVSATVTVTVTPTAGPDSGTTPAETPIDWTRTDLINDDLGSSLDVTDTTDGANGTTVFNGDGSVTYTPNAGFSGTDTFTYTVEDAEGQEVSATVTVTVMPTAGPDSGSTPAETPVTWTRTELINDDRGTSLDVVDTTDGANGTTVINGDGSVTYTPNGGFSGTDSFTYTVEDAEGQEVSATVTVLVTPTAGPDSGTTPAETAISWTQTELINDDVGSGLEVDSATNGTNGIVTVNATTGEVTYTPNDGFSGTDSFTYTVEDTEGQLVSATITVTVTPTAGPDSETTPAETPVTITEAELINDDLGSDLSVVDATDGLHGTTVVNGDGSVTYTPEAGFSGTDTFTYTVEDGEGQESTATVTILVTPTAGPDSGTTLAETPIAWTQAELINDDLGSGLEVDSATNGTNGIVTVNATTGEVTYTPNDGFSGTDSFTYTVEDNEGQLVSATVTVTVTPVAVDDADSTLVDVDITRNAANGVLPDDLGSSLTVLSHDAIPAAQGDLTINADGSYSFEPAPGYSGIVTAEYTAGDAEGQTATATLTIVVGPGAIDDVDSTDVNTPIARAAGAGVLINDAGTGLTVTGYDTIPAAQGTLVINADGGYTYTPATNFSGIVTAEYTGEDEDGLPVTATLTIDVRPAADDDNDLTDVNVAITRNAAAGVLTNDLGTSLEVTGHDAIPAAQGVLTINADGGYTFTPAADFSGTVTADYTAEDADGLTATATLTIVVTPSADDDTDVTDVNIAITRASGEGVLANDNGSSLAVTGHDAVPAAQGVLVISADGGYTFTPAANFSGTVTADYTAEDSEGQQVAATLTITVAPLADDDADTTSVNVAITRDAAAGVLANDNGSSLEVAGHDTIPASQGTLVINADGGYTFTPATNFSGTVTADYTAEDAEDQEVTATLTITVAPTAADDADSTDVNVAITRDAAAGVLANDNGSSLAVTGHGTIPAAQGVLTINADGGYTFTPAADFSGTVTADYTAEDAAGQEVTATLTITVAPSATDDTDSTDVNLGVTRNAADGVLDNDNGSSLTVVDYDTIPAAQGALTISADGGYTFTPAVDFSGTVTADYTAEDAEGQEITATLTIVVAPSADDDTDSTDVNVAITRGAADGVLDNDNGSGLTVTGHDTIPAAQGTLVIDADGGYTFTPATDFSGTVTADYTAEDAEGQEVTATLAIVVAPSATDDTDSTDVNVTITRDAADGVLDNDNGSSLVVTGHDTIPAAQGTLVINADGGYTFTPATDFSGTVTVDYTAEDAEGQEVAATLTITVAPSATDDADSTDVNVAITRDAADGVLDNDNGSGLTVTGHGTIPVAQGVLVIAADGGYTFTPATNFSGTVTAGYTAEDAEGQEATATLTIAVAPSAGDDSDTTAVDVPITRNGAAGVLINDHGSSLSVTDHDTISAGQGTLTINWDGSYTFTPAPGFTGTVTADYTVEDAEGQVDSATLTIVVVPTAADDTDSTDVNVGVTRGAADGVLDNDNGSGLTVTGHDTIPVLQGTLVINADGGYTFTPAVDFSGTVTADYTAEDAEGQEVTATLTITVAPSADNDTDSTDVNVPISRDAAAGVFANDHGFSLVITGYDTIPAAQGTLVINAEGGYTFTPAVDFSGIVTADYAAEDAEGQEVTATLTITVAPSAANDADATDVNVAITRDAADGVLINDHGTTLEVTGHDTIPAAQGTLVINADGSYIFTPAADFSGTVVAEYTVEDTDGLTATATLTIVVAPSATDDTDTTSAGVVISRDAADGVLDNDNGSSLAVVSYDTIPAAQGTLVINADGSYTFTPADGFSGTVTADYLAEDPEGQGVTATLTITVTPVANPDSGTTPAETPISWSQGSLINDDLGSTLTVVSAAGGTDGVVTLDGVTGDVTYTPNDGFSGIDTFTYTVEDAEGQSATATITVTVTPVANDESDSTDVNVAITRDAADGVLPNDLGSVLEVTDYDTIPASEGTLVIEADGGYTFTPTIDFSGTVTVDYTVEDASGQEATATLTIVVAPAANDDVDSTSVGVAITRDAGDGVLDNDHGSSLQVTGHDSVPAAQGTLAIEADGGYTFTPASGFSGTVSADYTAEDAEGQDVSATLTITVAPEANPDSGTTEAGTPITWTQTELTNDDSGSELQTVSAANGTNGVVTVNGTTGAVTYTPNDGFSGTDTFTYTVEDAEGQPATASVTVTVTPVAVDDADSTDVNVAITRNAANGVLDNDLGSSLEVTGHDTIPGAQGILEIDADGGYTFTPATSFSGTVTADYTAEDGEGQETTATLTIVVAPSASDDFDSTDVNTAITRDAADGVLDNDNGSSLEVTGYDTIPAAQGTLVIDTDGGYNFTPATNFSGTVTADYTAEDAEGQVVTATLTIVVGVAALDDVDTTSVNTAITRDATEGVLINDGGSGLAVTGHDTIPAAQGVLVINADGAYTFTPAPNFSGTVTADYTAEDSEGQDVTATLTITVTPEANADSGTTEAETPITWTQAELINDDAGSGLTTASATNGASGIVMVNLGTGEVTYLPNDGFSGTDTFTYTVEDAEGQTATATVTVTVTPVAVDDADSTDVNVAITRAAATGVLDNDLGSVLEVTGHDTISAAQGTLVIAADGGYTFTPATDFSGTVTADYTAEDTEGEETTATLTIVVAPSATDDTDSTDVNVAITRDAATGVLDNDNGSSLAVTGHDTISAAQGTLVIAADGGYTFTPATDFSGTVTADYTAEDAEGQVVTATLMITVAPSASDDADSTDVNVAITRDAAGGVLDNDNGSSLVVTGHDTIPAGQGVLAIGADGGYTFTPATGFSGTVTADYTAEDSEGQAVTATLTIVVTPSATDDSAATDVNVALTVDAANGVLDNDNGSGLQVTGHDVVDPAEGVLTINSDGSYTFTPAMDFSGTVTAEYTAEDAEGQEVTATLTITVAPSASDDTDSTDVNVAITRDATDGVLDNDNGSGLTVTGHDTIPAGQGVLAIDADGGYTFTPATNFSGTVTADYTADDAEGQAVTATLTILVGAVAQDDVDTTSVNTAITRDAAAGVLINDGGSGLTVTGHDAIPAGQGVLTINADGGYTFTPAPDFSGTVTAEYTAEDAEGQDITASLTITVTPEANADSGTTPAQTPITWTQAELINDDAGSNLQTVSATNGTNGSVTVNLATGAVTYTPNAGFSGQDAFTYTVEDAEGQSATATVTVTVTPVATNNADSTTGGTPITRDAANGVIPNDLGGNLRVVAFEAIDSSVGTLVINEDGSYTFTPVQGFTGTVTSMYTVEDHLGQTTTAILTIEVGADLPLVVNTTPRSVCVADVPYLDWDLALPAGFPNQGANPLTITFINPDGDDYVLTGLPLEGTMLWPGASADDPQQWPGWMQLDDGTYVETDGNFAWTRDNVQVVFSVNPEYTTNIQYPPATSACADVPEGLSESGGGLSHTGTDATKHVPFAAALMAIGGFLLLLARRRRDEDEETQSA